MEESYVPPFSFIYLSPSVCLRCLKENSLAGLEGTGVKGDKIEKGLMRNS